VSRRTYLDGILAVHRRRAADDRRDLGAMSGSISALAPARGFRDRLRRDAVDGLAVISEIKRRSPSKGDLNSDLDPADLARRYVDGGASCLSVLTDEIHFGGSIGDLQAARAAVDVPVLRKDFTVDARDVLDARLMGADCVLLIAAALSSDELIAFHRIADEAGLDALVEIHDEAELEVALAAGATLIGVNQRDLVTFEVDHQRAVRMAGRIPDDVVKVAESGVRGPDDARELKKAGYHAVLVGESLVTSVDPGEAVRRLRSV
jgi:indole-3-glycerol phosphate synthase